MGPVRSKSLRRGRARQTAYLVATAALCAVGSLTTAGSSVASPRKPIVCRGTFTKPGILVGKVSSNVIVKGLCGVKNGSATVRGSVTLSPGSAFAAAFGRNDKTGKGHSNLTITGNLVVDKGATAVIGCEAAHFACIDDNQKAPTLANKVTIGGNLIATGALGVIAHKTTVGGKVSDSGGGGGASCTTMPGIFAKFQSPQYSDFEDDSIAGSLSISKLGSCWLGALRDHIGKSFTLKNNKMGDPDAIEIGTNVIKGNLACSGNTMVWDSNETSSAPGVIYPRAPDPNKVKGKRSGQCNASTPLSMGGPSGKPGSF